MQVVKMVQMNSISASVIIMLLIFSNFNESQAEVYKKSEAIPSNAGLVNTDTEKKENITTTTINNNLTQNLLPQSSYDNFQVPESVKSFYYVFMGLAGAAIVLLIYKACQLRRNRAERKYGVLGDRNAQELTPLGVDDDSDNDQTLFEINHQRS